MSHDPNIEQLTVWKLPDGTLYESLSEARTASIRHDLFTEFNNATGADHPFDPYTGAAEFLEWVKENQSLVGGFLALAAQKEST